MRASPGLAAILLLLSAPVASALSMPGDAGDRVPAALVTLEVEEVMSLPPGRPAAVNVTVQYCTADGAIPSGPREVALAAEGNPDWLTVTFEPPIFVFPVVLPGECDEGRGLMRLNASADAPAWEISRFRIAAENPATGWRYAEVEYVFRVGYRGGLTLAPREVALTARAGELTPFRVAVTNDGNAETKFLLTTAGAVPGLQFDLPGPMVLGPGETGEWEVGVIPEGDRGRVAADLLLTSHAYRDHEALGEADVLHVEVETLPKLTGARLPGPGMILAAFVIAAAAAVTRLGGGRGGVAARA